MSVIKRNFALVVKAVIVKGDKVLLLKRSKREMGKSYINKHMVWDFPGGSVNFYETSLKALVREIGEETGLKVNIIKPFNIHDVMKSYVHLSVVTYICLYTDGDVLLSSEHSDFFWLNIEEMKSFDIPKWMIEYCNKGLEESKFII